MRELQRVLLALVGTFEPAQPPTGKRRLATEQVALAEARSALFRGEVDAAVVLAEEAVRTAGSIESPELKEHAELLQRIYTQRIGDLGRRVRIVGVPEDADPRATFLLSRIDRARPILDLLDVSGMPMLEALRLITQLLRQTTLATE